MPNKQQYDRFDRRLKLHDLQVLMTVAQVGGMSKAARQLNTTQSAISRSIADLEQALGVRLLERSRSGVVPTNYGRVLLSCGTAVFDDLRQGIRTLEFLADPTVGEINVGGNEPQILGIIPAIINRMRRKFPKFVHNVTSINSLAQQYLSLRERRVDLILARIPQSLDDDIVAETLFLDRTFVVAGANNNKWARRRRIELSELADEPWCWPPIGSLPGTIFADSFRASGIKFPPAGLTTGSPQMHMKLLASGPFLAVLPESMMRFGNSFPSLKKFFL